MGSKVVPSIGMSFVAAAAFLTMLGCRDYSFLPD
jgi:hypothetical protein